MAVLHQMLYVTPAGSGGPPQLLGTSLTSTEDLAGWGRAVEPWLPAARPPARAYLNYGRQVALLRWRLDTPAAGPRRLIHVLLAYSDVMTVPLALGMPDWDLRGRVARGPLPELSSTELAARAAAGQGTSARSAQAAELLVPMLAQVLASQHAGSQAVVVVPRSTPAAARAALGGLADVLAALGDGRALSIVTGGRPPLPALSGLLAVTDPAPADGWPAVHSPAADSCRTAAIVLAASYADHGVDALRRLLSGYGIPELPSREEKYRRVLELWPAPGRTDSPGRPAAPASIAAARPESSSAGTSRDSASRAAAPTVRRAGSATVICPVCLGDFSADGQPRLRYNPGQPAPAPVSVPPDASSAQRARLERNTVVRCPGSGGQAGEHFLPADYAGYGSPVTIGFVGASRSGKSHLMTTMIAAMEPEALAVHGVEARPLDLRLHQAFVDGRVQPLLRDRAVLPATTEDVVTFADAFVVRVPGSPPRVVALFDVAGGDLTTVHNPRKFLEIVDGLVFVVDPDQLKPGGPGDPAFGTVLMLLADAGRLASVSAAVVLAKADLLRFEDPVTTWLRRADDRLVPELILRESEDVYAYLYQRGASAWARPYHQCPKATLHVASATGGAAADGSFPRGVRPQRVLLPMLALLAMTGVTADPDAAEIGV